MLFGQTFEFHDIIIVGLLIVLEGVLSIDNALVLGILAKRLPKSMQNKALTYGLIGAFVFRLIAIATAAWLLHWTIVKLLGGAYLIFVAVKHFLFETKQHHGLPAAVDAEGTPSPVDINPAERGLAKFWPTVFVIEMTDIAFAVDSIVAAIGVVGPPPPQSTRHPKLWVVIIGGFLGVILMRFAAVIFIKLLDKFPRFEMAAYLLVIVIGGKLVVDWSFNSTADPHYIDFHNWRSLAFWIFWGLMITCFSIGFIKPKPKHSA